MPSAKTRQPGNHSQRHAAPLAALWGLQFGSIDSCRERPSHLPLASTTARFNLAKLVCGAEGGLGVITELKLNLAPLPTHTALAIVHFNSLPEALTAVPLMLEVGPSAVELLDNLGLTLCREVPEYARLLSTFIERHAQLCAHH